MSESPKHSPPKRGSSDFSIERILARDDDSSSASPGLLAPEQTLLHQRLQPRATVSLVAQNKLHWLRDFCKVESHELRAHTDESNTEPLLNRAETSKSTDHPDSRRFDSEELSWLRCTRYCPPKLPRKPCAGKSLKRKPGSHPRIPFTKYQLELLEEKYKTHAYLSRKDVIHLSDSLQLPQTRIKIWFQNRRARERRESQSLEQTHTTTRI